MTRQVSNSVALSGGRFQEQVSIFAVVVLYQMRPAESPTLVSLQASLESLSNDKARLVLILADNTPGGQAPGELPVEGRYEAFPDNPGLAKPYNKFLAEAAAAGFDWFLTLDQDTDLPRHYLEQLTRYAKRYASDLSVGAIVPHIEEEGVPLSPFRFVGGSFPHVVRPGVDGILGSHASALNSAALLRVASLQSFGGYDERFPLNNSDTALFERLDQYGFRTVVMGGVAVEHELAIMRREDRMTPQRYEQLLRDERDFWDLHKGMLARAERLLRLMGRLAKGFKEKEGSAFQAITFAEVRLRLFSRRRTRVERLQRTSESTITAPVQGL